MLKIVFILFLNIVFLDAVCIKTTTPMMTTTYYFWQWKLCGSRKRCIDGFWLGHGYPIPTTSTPTPTTTPITTTTISTTTSDYRLQWCEMTFGSCDCEVNQTCCGYTGQCTTLLETTAVPKLIWPL